MFLVEKKIDKNDFEKSLHFEGGGSRPIWKKVYILNFFYDGFPKLIFEKPHKKSYEKSDFLAERPQNLINFGKALMKCFPATLI